MLPKRFRHPRRGVNRLCRWPKTSSVFAASTTTLNTAGPGNWTATFTGNATVTCIGGGGGGGGNDTNALSSGGGGGGGGRGDSVCSFIAGHVYAYVVGAGGTGGTVVSPEADVGGDSSIAVGTGVTPQGGGGGRARDGGFGGFGGEGGGDTVSFGGMGGDGSVLSVSEGGGGGEGGGLAAGQDGQSGDAGGAGGTGGDGGDGGHGATAFGPPTPASLRGGGGGGGGSIFQTGSDGASGGITITFAGTP